MRNVFNFSAGPAMLPEAVLVKAQEEMLNWQGTGMSIMEIGHRTELFQSMVNKIEENLRELMGIPENYQVLFLAGGATAQFAMVPLNLLTEIKKADYIDTGIWSQKAIKEASRYGEVNVVANAKKVDGHWLIPDENEWQLSEKADYFHYTPNETIGGLAFNYVPKKPTAPLVADMTSMILSEPINVRDFGVIYAGAQKNLGQAGITVVIIRKDLIKEPIFLTPTLYQYKIEAESSSLYNTPPTYSWYILGLVLEWMKNEGGLDGIYQKNCRNAARLYDLIDHSNPFYSCDVLPRFRSKMNVVFSLPNENLLSLFLKQSYEVGLTFLKGHKLLGGARASIYNAMPEEGITKLIAFMQEFAAQYG